MIRISGLRFWGFSNPNIPQAGDTFQFLFKNLFWTRVKVNVCEYYQQRNEASYASRRKMAKAKSVEFL